jgi:hypothetical protein
VDHPKKLNLYLSARNYGDHRTFDSDDDSMGSASKRVNVVTVEGISIDDYLADYNKSVDFIKVDVQGAEYSVLQGMKKVLLANHHVVLLTEFWPDGMRLNGTDPKMYLQELRALGFRIHQLASDGLLTCVQDDIVSRLGGHQDYTNLVCVRKPVA